MSLLQEVKEINHYKQNKIKKISNPYLKIKPIIQLKKIKKIKTS